MRGRAPASDSVTGRTAAAQEKPVEVPSDLPELTQKEMAAFEQYGAFRGGWKAAELRGLHRAVRLESNIAALVAESERVQRYIEKPDGTFVAHPIFRDIRDETKVLQSQLRMLGLNVTPEGRRRIANQNPPSAPPQPQGMSLVKK